jgi:hypothetical protein
LANTTDFLFAFTMRFPGHGRETKG